MPNYNRMFDCQEFEPLLEKYRQLCEIRSEVELLTGEVSHDKIIEGLRKRRSSESIYSCPPHLYLGMTPKKQEVVRNSWDSEIRLLRQKGVREEAIAYLVGEMRMKETINEVRSYLLDRKNCVLHSKEEKSSNRSFNRTRNQ